MSTKENKGYSPEAVETILHDRISSKKCAGFSGPLATGGMFPNRGPYWGQLPAPTRKSRDNGRSAR